MSKIKKLLAVTAALLICSGTMTYMPQNTFINANINTAYAAEGSVAINAANFPDEIFREYVADKLDKDKDGVLSAEEIDKVTNINVNFLDVSDITGIEYFTALTELLCYMNQLTSLDISNNARLTHLDCSANKLTSLDVSNNTELTKLDCYSNDLSSLDISNNTKLTHLECSSNYLTSLDLSKNTELISLGCCLTQITSLDLSNNTKLTVLECINNPKLTSLELSKNTELTVLRCGSNQLTSLDVSKNTKLELLSCTSNQLTSLDISNNALLKVLYCNDNLLTSLDVSNNTELTELYCIDNTYKIALTDGKFDLSTLPAGFDLTKASEWTNGTVEGNILTVEDASKNVTYTYDCGNEKTATFTLIPTDEPITPPTDEPTLPLGDINGDSTVDASDASNVLAVYALVSTGKDSELTAEQIAAADVNKDGTIDASDASLILAYYAHISTGGTGTLEEYLLDVRN